MWALFWEHSKLKMILEIEESEMELKRKTTINQSMFLKVI
jgi:hypothetical protein